jgi:hypothetical protein
MVWGERKAKSSSIETMASLAKAKSDQHLIISDTNDCDQQILYAYNSVAFNNYQLQQNIVFKNSSEKLMLNLYRDQLP